MDPATTDKLKYLHPKVREEVIQAYNHINQVLFNKKIKVKITQTLRTFKEQDKLYSQGRTLKLTPDGKPLKVVTNAKGGQSIHNYGLAFDFVIVMDSNNDGKYDKALWNINTDYDKDNNNDWMEVVSHFKKLGWNWGGDWKKFPDYPHLEKVFSYTWQNLLQKYRSGDTFIEIINGQSFKWVSL